jgi:hypothetical protein
MNSFVLKMPRASVQGFSQRPGAATHSLPSWGLGTQVEKLRFESNYQRQAEFLDQRSQAESLGTIGFALLAQKVKVCIAAAKMAGGSQAEVFLQVCSYVLSPRA